MQYKEINAQEIIAELKDFQKETVDYVYNRLYNEGTTNRFLIADEVGLGKTIVAKGLIAKVLDKFQREKSRKRVDILYICSNAEIARQNVAKLNIVDEAFSLASRITLLPIKSDDLKSNLVNFISFTPGTSFELKSRGGVKEERALIYHVLKKEWKLRSLEKYKRFFKCTARSNWNRYLIDFRNDNNIDPDLAKLFVEKIDDYIQNEKRVGKKDLKTRFEETANAFAYKRKIADELNRERYMIIGELRSILAQSCIYALKPELIILDEFQRFKHLFDEDDETGQLAQSLFNLKDVKIVFLSATPYKMYTMNHEQDSDHFEDFLHTVGILFDSKDKLSDLQESLSKYKNLLFRLGANRGQENLQLLKEAKGEIEDILKQVMVRTERVGVTEKRDGMIAEQVEMVQLTESELYQFLELDRLATMLDLRDNIEYWKSASYLISFMENSYKMKERLKNHLNRWDDQYEVDLRKISLDWSTIDSYQRVDPANGRLNTLLVNTVETGGWKLLWIPPALPYYEPGGAFAEAELQDYTKDLVFSSWQVVPRVIAAVVSYEAEREMVQIFDRKARYSTERTTRSQLLNFSKSDGKLTGMPLFTLFYPCITLAENINLLALGSEMREEDDLGSQKRILTRVESIIEELLEEACEDVNYDKSSNTVDQRWYWAALAILDRHFEAMDLTDLLEAFESTLPIESKSDDGGFGKHMKLFIQAYNNPNRLKLTKKPDDLIEVLAKTAIGSPAISVLRSYLRWWELGDPLLFSSATIGVGFRNMYNLSDSITLIRGLYQDGPYWLKVLQYGVDGNLQAMIDEYLHMLNEVHHCRNSDCEDAVQKLEESFYDAISLKTVSLTFDETTYDQNQLPALESHRMRCHYALRFSKEKSYQDNEMTRLDKVRNSFNSPFRPFVLATTSVGQEGLDFHHYCHSIYHWNLPPNPVDFEQREGRVHRYKGHVIRKNIAFKYGKELFSDKEVGCSDPWQVMFEMAQKGKPDHLNDLVPYWVFEVENGYKVKRNIPLIPLSREGQKFTNLKKSLAAYRMVFGQTRQEELVKFINMNIEDAGVQEIMEYKIDLSPTKLGSWDLDKN